MSVQVCKWEVTKSAGICDVLDAASRWFGLSEKAVEEWAGRFTKGRNKGKVRGWIVWRKCREGGWCYPIGGVVRPGIIFAMVCKTFDESCAAMNLPTDRFISGAERVDTCYGHDPVKAREDRAAAQAAAEQARAAAAHDLTDDEKQLRAAYLAALDLLETEAETPDKEKEAMYRNAARELQKAWTAAKATGDFSAFKPKTVLA